MRDKDTPDRSENGKEAVEVSGGGVAFGRYRDVKLKQLEA
jgi:hypothetical protein